MAKKGVVKVSRQGGTVVITAIGEDGKEVDKLVDRGTPTVAAVKHIANQVGVDPTHICKDVNAHLILPK